MVAASGQASGITLNIPGARLRNVLVRANTATTIFRANLNDGSDTRINWDYEQGELNDMLDFPVSGNYTFSITNASPDDTFRVILSFQEF